MKTLLQIVVCLVCVASIRADEIASANADPQGRTSVVSSDDLMNAQPKLLHISATVDGSGKIVFTRQSVRYEHKQWGRPINVFFGEEPWLDLGRTPPVWLEAAGHLDLTKAWIVKREGRDVIALEQTADGFDLYLCDSPNGAAKYEVLIAIPRRN